MSELTAAPTIATPETGDLIPIRKAGAPGLLKITLAQLAAFVGGGGGGGANWYFQPPSAADFTPLSGNAALPNISDDTDVGCVMDFGGPSVTGTIAKAATKALPAAGDWEVRARLTGNLIWQNFAAFGLFAIENAGLKPYVANTMESGRTLQTRRDKMGGGYLSDFNAGASPTNSLFFRLVYTSATGVYSSYISYTGKHWILLGTTTNAQAGFVAKADRIGFGIWTGFANAYFPTVVCDYWWQSF